MNINLTREELDKLVKSNDLERYTQQQFKQFVESNEEVLIKGERGELDELEKSEYDTLIAEIQSFTTVNVFDTSPESKNRIIKSIELIRPKQVEWDDIEKSEDEEEIEKAKSGVYTDTALNRKLGRVGQKYGSKKQSTDEGDGRGKSDIKTVSLSSKKGGGFTLNVKMSNGSTKHFPVDNKELASVKNSPVQKDGISKNRTLFELAQHKLNKDKKESKQPSTPQEYAFQKKYGDNWESKMKEHRSKQTTTKDLEDSEKEVFGMREGESSKGGKNSYSFSQIREAFNDKNRYGSGQGTDYQKLVKKVRDIDYEIDNLPYAEQPSSKLDRLKFIQKKLNNK